MFWRDGAHTDNPASLWCPQTVVERFNFEINMRVLIVFRRLINLMEENGLLDKHNLQQVRAFSCIAQPICQYGLDVLKAAWNEHRVRPITGRPGTGGRPNARAHTCPHPGGQLQLPAGFDGIREYDLARPGKAAQARVPANAHLKDPLLEYPQRQQQRAAALTHIMGSDMCPVWMELLAGGCGRFLTAYQCFLSFQ